MRRVPRRRSETSSPTASDESARTLLNKVAPDAGRHDEAISHRPTIEWELSPVDRELLQGMCNCYSVCGEDFENTVGMVASSRGRTKEDVKETLARLAEEHGKEEEFLTLRRRLPADFPF